MTPLVWAWLLSSIGAALFFAAGAVFAGRQLARVGSLSFLAPRQTAALPAPATQLETMTERVEGRQDRFTTPTRATDLDAEQAGLRHELAMSQETLRGRESQLEQLRDENARLRAMEEEFARAKRELSLLTEQTRVLRAQAYVSKPLPKRPSRSTPLLSSRGRALQTIVDTETQFGGAKSAVIADELGLLVAASGATQEYGDALAALGAYLADVGTKTRDVLPLQAVRQVVVRDEHDVTLTVRPLTTDDPGLALVTLAVSSDAQKPTDERHN